MKFGPKRAHVMFIFERFINDFGLFVLALIIFLFVRDVQIILDNLFIVAVAVFGPISRCIKYFFTRYTINSECLLVESGWLKKEKLEIPLATISSVDMTQTLLFQITHVYALQVENAGSIGGSKDGSVKLILGKEDAELAKAMLLAKKNGINFEQGESEQILHSSGEEEQGQTLRASAGEVLTMCCFQIRWLVIVIQMLAYIGIVTSFVDQYFLTGDTTSTEMLFDLAWGLAPLVIIGIVLAAYIFSVFISAVLSFIKYYNFRVINRGDSLKIEYGLFTRKSHTLMKEKISGISFQQSLIMRCMKKGTLEIFVTGYGGTTEDNQQETVLLYPIVEEKKIYSFINWFMPEPVEVPQYENAPAKSLPYFFICARFVFSLILSAGLILVPAKGGLDFGLTAAGAMILLLAAGSVLMEHKTSAVAYNGSMVTMKYGGFRKHIALLCQNKLEYVEDSASQLKRNRRRLITITAGVLAPTGMSSHSVRNMDISVLDNVKEKLIY